MRVIGLDLSLRATGIAVVDTDTRAIDVRTLKPPKGFTRSHTRLQWLIDHVADTALTGAGLAVIEGLAFDAHDRDRQGAGLSWMVRHRLWRMSVPYALVPPSTLKLWAAGHGHAGKDAMIAAAVDRWPAVGRVDDNGADAVHLAAAGAWRLGRPLPGTPDGAALASVAWPELLSDEEGVA